MNTKPKQQKNRRQRGEATLALLVGLGVALAHIIGILVVAGGDPVPVDTAYPAGLPEQTIKW
jgi:hypothetical protein